jgi:poly-gamma-glutamate synthesis protein (capsule biosynthesis protein)
MEPSRAPRRRPPGAERAVIIFLSGDVMTGRGIDQLLAHPSEPRLRESYVRDARGYIALAAAASGPIPHPVAPTYPWGDALAELERVAPAARVINLETSVTRSDDYWRGKPIHYRMHPANIGCLTAARIDACALANNHVLDFGYAGLAETLAALSGAGIKAAGAGRDLPEARRPAAVDLGGDRALHVFSFGAETSGIPREWAAAAARPGVALLPDLSQATAADIAARVRRVKRPGDIALASIHWGSNWGYEVPGEHARFARRLIDGGVDIIHGHSSHHPRPIEVYRGRLILYGCGDLLNDYEGIRGYEDLRSDLALLYFAAVAPGSGELVGLSMTPLRRRRCRLGRASQEELAWLAATLDRISAAFGSRVARSGAGTLELRPG